MEQINYTRVRALTDFLNLARDEYYNKNAPSISDADYDRMFDELKARPRYIVAETVGESNEKADC